MAELNYLTDGIDLNAAANAPRSALNINPVQVAPPRDALDFATGAMNVAKSSVELQAVQAGLEAKKRAGQIMAVAPSLDEAVKAMGADPLVAGFAPEIMATVQSISGAQTAQAGERQAQAASGLGTVMHGLLTAVNDPVTFDNLISANLETLSPTARAAVEKAIPGIKAALFDGLDKLDPTAAGAEWQQRLGAMIVGSGFSAEGVRAVTGTLAPQLVEVTGPEGQRVTMQVGGPITGGGSGVGPDGVISEGPSVDEATRLQAEGQISSGIESDLSAAAGDLPKILTNMDHMLDAMKVMETGGGADIRANLGKALQFFQNAGVEGISDELVNGVANGNLAATQTLQALLRTFVTDQMKQSTLGTGAGQVAAEVQAFLDMADITTDPEALQALLGVSRQKLQIDYDRAQAWPEFKKLVEGGKTDYTLPQFYQWFNNEKKNAPEAAKPADGDKAKKRSLEDIFGE
jgi:hypothetical protein